VIEKTQPGDSSARLLFHISHAPVNYEAERHEVATVMNVC
jgi:hypothetical protein